MHISEGMLSTPEGVAVLATGAVISLAGTALGLKRLDHDNIPRTAMLASLFFVVSLIPIPFAGLSLHLVMIGLMGLVLGWLAFPALLLALLLQAIQFGHGGLTSLGVNTATMALPAVLCYYVFRQAVRARSSSVVFTSGMLAGVMGVMGGASLTAFALVVSGKEFAALVQPVFFAHLPFAAVEGCVTGSVVLFLRKVRPEVFSATRSDWYLRHDGEEPCCGNR